MLQIFSCACWPSICLLWKNVSSGIRPFLIRLFVLLILSYMSSLYINPFWSHHMQTFSPIQYTVFILSMASFAGQKLLHLIRFHLFIFAFVSFALGDSSKKILLQFMSKSVLPMFSSRSFMVSGLIFRYLGL